ncbi:hypothetical protein [Microcystis sp. M061S2]|uniref:hypothetical protein n=1 Tax=Microcystis sp. M061S2 TaxID=2771171 RepID=UPI002584FCA6|nr:hypothetical protein [Microcystis sp. M061S2]MCA2656368.1 hypothetical protein [Microcystis sp. M061S2]
MNKPWYLSKTILVQIIASVALVVANFQPSVASFLTQHFAEAGLGWAAINIVLRVVTKKEIG